MNRFIPALAAACFALSAAVAHAQPTGDAGKGPMGGGHPMMKPCNQEPDPAKCEARRKEMREHMKQVHESCKDKPDRRACMMESMCAKAPDPAKCQAQAKEREAKMSNRMDEHQAAAEACTGKRGEALMKCMHEQHPRRKPDAK
jgi:hypothetical protein